MVEYYYELGTGRRLSTSCSSGTRLDWADGRLTDGNRGDDDGAACEKDCLDRN
jgi:hypothetical protein